MPRVSRADFEQRNDDATRTLSGMPLRALRRFVLERKPTQVVSERVNEHCDLCGLVLPTEHHHLLELANRNIICACQACALLFDTTRAHPAKYRLVSTRYLVLPDFTMTAEQWDALMIPVNIVFFFFDSKEQQIKAFYPGPAGATESLLSMEHWASLTEANPLLHQLEPDVEALLMNRLEGASVCYLVPIDSCYQLVGLIRVNWRGLSGGEEVGQAMGTFFAELQARSQSVSAEQANGLIKEGLFQQGESDAGFKL